MQDTHHLPHHQPAADSPVSPVSPVSPARPARHASLARLLLRAALAVLVFILAGAVLAALLAQMQVSAGQLLVWQQRAMHLRHWGALIQAGLLALLVWRWRAVIDWAARLEVVKQHETDRLLSLRWRAAGVFALYLLLLPIGPATLWRAWLALAG